MSGKIIIWLLCIITVAFAVSCSAGSGNAINPQVPDESPGADGPAIIDGCSASPEASGNAVCLGMWQVAIDPAGGTVDITRLRASDLIINIIGYLETQPFTNVDINWSTLKIGDGITDKTVEVGLILTHPLANTKFTCFDLRGVVFGPRVTNGDGLTILTGPEFFSGVPFGYKDGLLGTPDSTANYEGLAGYRYYCHGLGSYDDLATFFSSSSNLTERGKFAPGDVIERFYVLDWEGCTQNFFVFNYALYANYDWPSGSAPYDVKDFPITTANSAEAFCCSVTEIFNNLYYTGGSGGGGQISLDVELWDWQGNIEDVTIESLASGVMPQTPYDDDSSGSTAYSHVYEFTNVSATPTTTADLDILITATDPVTYGQGWFMGMLGGSHAKYSTKIDSYFIYATTVSDCPAPVVSGINPSWAYEDTNINATITCSNLVNGASLGVCLRKSGESDIYGTNVTYIDTTTFSADLGLTGAAIGFWDVVVTNGCGNVGIGVGMFEVKACPTPVVSAINPSQHCPDNTQFDANITGSNFVNGAGLAAKLKKTGQADIVATNVSYVSSTQIDCKLILPTTTATGYWDVEVTNGCGTTGTGAGLLEVTACPVGNVVLEVIREDPDGPSFPRDYAITLTNNVKLSWNAAPGAAEYGIFRDMNPYDGMTFIASCGDTPSTEFYTTLFNDQAAAYVVRSRYTVGGPWQSSDSEIAFVDFEQAEDTSAPGSWHISGILGQSIYEHYYLHTTRTNVSQHVNSDAWAWFDATSIGYPNMYEIFYSDQIPEVPATSVYRLEVVWNLLDYWAGAGHEDGFAIGWLTSQPVYGQGPSTHPDFRVASIIAGPAYKTGLAAIGTEFPNNGASGAGYTGTSAKWELSAADVSAIASDSLDWVCVAHATSDGATATRYYRVDDIALIIY